MLSLVQAVRAEQSGWTVGGGEEGDPRAGREGTAGALPLQVAGGEGLLPVIHVPRDRRRLLCSALRPWLRGAGGEKEYRGTVWGPCRHFSQVRPPRVDRHLVSEEQPGDLRGDARKRPGERGRGSHPTLPEMAMM